MSANNMVVACALAATLGGCGVFTPEKYALVPDYIEPNFVSTGGKYENSIVNHIQCEIMKGIWEATSPHNPALNVPWLKSYDWGTSVTLTITVEDQSALSPSVSSINPIGAAGSMQSFTLGLGANGSANATRTETIQYTYVNSDLWRQARAILQSQRKSVGDTISCEDEQQGIMIDGDLKIWQFIYDKAVIASLGNGTSSYRGWFPYNTFTESLTFVATLGGSITPTWKLTRISANSSGTFASATRTNTNQLTITIGPVGTRASAKGPTQLSTSAQNQHNTQVQAGAIAQQLPSQSLSTH
jgi:hypothetical protein